MAGRTQVGAWQLVQPLGSGSFGQTWRAVGANGQQAAVKLLEHPPGGEMTALAHICHPAVVSVFDAGASPTPYLAMELAKGVPLDQLGAVDVDTALHLAATLLDALDAVHTVGLIHGDIKADNIMVDPATTPPGLKLIDFGLVGHPEGGTLEWGSPERLDGALASPQADTYAVGLVLYLLLHGTLPWPELPVGQALLKRRSAEPDITEGPDWLQELLGRLLERDPARRIDAAAAADVLAAHGIAVPVPDAALIRRRARTVHVACAHDPFVARALDDGGNLALVGPSGSGRSHALHEAGVELSARGASWVMLRPGPPWKAIRDALRSPRLPGPPVPLPTAQAFEDRVYEAARALLRRAGPSLYVLADDIDSLDAPSQALLDMLADDPGVHVLVAASTPPEWSGQVAALQRWEPASVEVLYRQLLGAGTEPLDTLVDAAFDVSGGHPGVAVDYLIASLEGGATLRANRRWVVDETRLASIEAASARRLEDLPEAALDVGTALACLDDIASTRTLCELTLRDEGEVRRALDLLSGRRLVHLEHDEARILDRAIAASLEASHPDPATLHLRIADLCSDESAARRVFHYLQAGARAEVADLAYDAIDELLALDVPRAAVLAEQAWALAPTPAVAVARVRALTDAGDVADAVAFAEERLADGDDPDLLHRYARALLSSGRPEEALAAISRAMELASRDRLAMLALQAQTLFRLERMEETEALCRSAPRPRGDGEIDAWLRLQGTLAQALQGQGQLPEAIQHLSSLGDAGEGRASRALLDGVLGRLLWHAGRLGEAAEAMERAGRRQSGLGSLDRARMINNAALATISNGDLGGAIEHWERAQVLLERMQAEDDLVATRVNLCAVYTEAGRWERARVAGYAAAARAETSGAVAFLTLALGNLGDLHRHLGEAQVAAQHYERAIELAREHDLHGQLAENLQRRATLAVSEEERSAQDWLDQAIAAAEQAEDKEQLARATGQLAVLQARQDDLRARHTLAQARSHAKGVDNARLLADWRLCAIAVALALGHIERARVDATRVRLFAEEFGSIVLRNQVRVIEEELGAEPRDDGSRITLAVAAELSRSPGSRSNLREIAEGARRICQASRGVVVSVCPREVLASSVAVASDRPEDAIAWEVVEQCVRTGRRMLVSDLDDRPDLRASTSVVVLQLSSVMCVPIVRDAEVIGALYVDSHVTTEHELLEVEQHLEALASFAAITLTQERAERQRRDQRQRALALAHDIRNLAQLLDAFDEEAPEVAADTVRLVSSHLQQMTSDYLQRVTVPASSQCIVQVTREVIQLLGVEAQQQGATVVVEAPAALAVLAHPTTLRRSLFNVLHNALRHGSGGTITVRIHPEGRTVVWSTQDQGDGLPTDWLGEIAPVEESTPDASGHGLGLLSTARALRDMGGRLEASNPTEGGARLTIHLLRSQGARS